MIFSWMFSSTRTGGSSAYIAQPKDIKRLLLEKFDALAQTYAEDVTLDTTWWKGVELSYAFRLQPDPAPIDWLKIFAALGSNIAGYFHSRDF